MKFLITQRILTLTIFITLDTRLIHVIRTNPIATTFNVKCLTLIMKFMLSTSTFFSRIFAVLHRLIPLITAWKAFSRTFTVLTSIKRKFNVPKFILFISPWIHKRSWTFKTLKTVLTKATYEVATFCISSTTLPTLVLLPRFDVSCYSRTIWSTFKPSSSFPLPHTITSILGSTRTSPFPNIRT